MKCIKMSILKHHCGNCVIQPLVTESMIHNLVSIADNMFTEEKTKYYRTEDQKIKYFIPKPKRSIKKIAHSVLLKKELRSKIDEMKQINIPLNEKLNEILKEEDRIIEQRNSRKVSDSFDFRPFEPPTHPLSILNLNSNCNGSSKTIIPYPRKHNKTVCFSSLKNYDEIIRNKVSNENNAKNKIAKLQMTLKDKKEKYDQINRKVQDLFAADNDNKIFGSRNIDSNVFKMQEISLLQGDSIAELAHKTNIHTLIKEANQTTLEINSNIKTICDDLQHKDEYYKKEINAYINQMKDLHIEIKLIQHSINKSVKQSIDYYLEILSNGIDTRNEGFSWIIKRLIELDYEVKPEDFPAFFDISKVGFVVKISKLQLAKGKLIEQLRELKEKIIQNRGKIIKSKSHQRLHQKENDVKKKTKIIQPHTRMTRNDFNDSYPYQKIYCLIKKYKFQYVTPEQEGKIKKCLLFSNVNKYKANESLLQFNPMITRTHSVYGLRNDKRISQIILNDNQNEKNKEQLRLLKKIITIKQLIKSNEEEISSMNQIEISEFKEKYKNKMYINDNINKLSSALFGNKLLL